jgi:hypothetical protein
MCLRPRIPTFRAQKDLEQVEEQKPSYCLLSLSSLTSENTSCSGGRDIDSVASIGLLAMITRYCFMSVASKLLPFCQSYHSLFKFDYFRRNSIVFATIVIVSRIRRWTQVEVDKLLLLLGVFTNGFLTMGFQVHSLALFAWK